ncbi:hypothetical protein LOD99_15707 [Oopsacas minuta]|uniref:[histone H3]-trimethyl-L-lysine(9) demethylase n=1 Tax=Oopsacas minuta TaxID=111878 RepID=A0AAV7K9Q1_9METZ|nr:hypothetical protein LOD99_15707 [Oopsacas minuta]
MEKCEWELEDGVMVFKPTMDQFRDFSSFISCMEAAGAHEKGLAKVIPPKEWSPNTCNYSEIDFSIPCPILQLVSGSQGVYQMYNIQKKPTNFKSFRKLTLSDEYKSPKTQDIDELERKYWKNVTFNQVIYGADVSGTLFDSDVNIWNISKLDSILQEIPRETGIKIPGVCTAYLYFGMWRSTFGWHIEDMDLYSINYLHYGAPKVWYGIPATDAHKLEQLSRSFFPDHFRDCPAFLRHKMTVISPTVLKKYSVPFSRVVQREGQIVISFPRAYHSGFNLGLNIAESTNFATQGWIDIGKKAVVCHCDPDGVHIDMDLFIKKYQPEQYQAYLAQKKKSNQDKGRAGKNKSTKLASTNSGLLEKELDTLTDKDQKLEAKMNDWCSKFSGLWKGQSPDNFVFESAFNLVMSQKGSRCSICALFEDPSPFQGFSREELLTTYWALKRNKKGGLMNPDTILESLKAPSSPVDMDWKHISNQIVTKKKIFPKKRGGKRIDRSPLPQLDPPEINKIISQELRSPLSPTCTEDLLNSTRATYGSDSQTSSYLFDQFSECKSKSDTVVDSCIVLENSETFSLAEETVFALKSDSSNGAINGDKKPRLSETCPSPDLTQSYDLPRSTYSFHNALAIPSREKVNSKSSLKCQSDDSSDEEDEEIIQCIHCRIAVHPSCYGLRIDDVRPNWLCSRCQLKSYVAQCELCQLRGGPLKPTSNGKWAHVTCAVVVPEVLFGDPDKREPVNISCIPKSRWRIKCLYCNTHGAKGGASLQCGYRKCSSSFHVTCAQYNGIVHWAPDNDGSKGIRANCPRHDKDKQEEVRREQKLIPIGDPVIAKINTTKYTQAEVIERNEQPCFEVEFIEDESVCFNVPPSDIQSDSTSINKIVKVKWSDGLLYDGIIKAEHKELIYTIKFDNGSVNTFPRDEIYTLQDKLPKKVQSKLCKVQESAKFEETTNLMESSIQ